MYLVTARGKTSSMSVGTASATSALAKLADLQGDGFRAIVFDARGRECSMEQLRAEAFDEARASQGAAPSQQV